VVPTTQTYWRTARLSQLSSNIAGLAHDQLWRNDRLNSRPRRGSRITQVTALRPEPRDGRELQHRQPAEPGDSRLRGYGHLRYDSNTMRIAQYQFKITVSPSQALLPGMPTAPSGSGDHRSVQQRQTQTCTYAHDDLIRIAQVDCGNGGWGQSFGYDPFGNLTKNGLANHTGNSFQPTYSSTTNRMTSLPGISHHVRRHGNVTNDSNHTYSWTRTELRYH